MNSVKAKHLVAKDILNIVFFIILIILGSTFLNTYVFRSFNVDGRSMETTFYTGDKVIVNRLPVTMASFQNQQYIPERNQIIVFKNPNITSSSTQQYIVKRVVGLPGDRVEVKNGKITVYNDEHPTGYNPDTEVESGTPGSPVSGAFSGTVPKKTLFVVGDHRQGSYSCDSRGCMGYIPLYSVVGPVSMRVWPLTGLSTYK